MEKPRRLAGRALPPSLGSRNGTLETLETLYESTTEGGISNTSSWDLSSANGRICWLISKCRTGEKEGGKGKKIPRVCSDKQKRPLYHSVPGFGVGFRSDGPSQHRELMPETGHTVRGSDRGQGFQI